MNDAIPTRPEATVGLAAAARARARLDAQARSRLVSMYVNIRSRFVLRSLDAMLTAQLVSSEVSDSGTHHPGGGSRSYRRVQSWASVFARLFPGLSSRCRRTIFDPSGLPLRAADLKLLSYGSGVTVFVFDPEGPRRSDEPQVLKVFRKSLGRGMDELLAQASQRQATYRAVSRWYRGCGVVPPTQFLILHGPLLGCPALSCIQPYVAAYRDLFDLATPELLRSLETHDELRAQFQRFVTRTLHAASTEDACIDLVGRNNVVITCGDDPPRLRLLDLGVYDFQTKAVRAPNALVKVRERLGYLETVVTLLRDDASPHAIDTSHVPISAERSR